MAQKLDVSGILGKNSAILHSDGMILYSRIVGLREEKEIQISFAGIQFCTTAFLNASIGQYLINFPDEKKRLNVVDYGEKSASIKEKIKLVVDNALDQKKRARQDESTREIFYS